MKRSESREMPFEFCCYCVRCNAFAAGACRQQFHVFALRCQTQFVQQIGKWISTDLLRLIPNVSTWGLTLRNKWFWRFRLPSWIALEFPGAWSKAEIRAKHFDARNTDFRCHRKRTVKITFDALTPLTATWATASCIILNK